MNNNLQALLTELSLIRLRQELTPKTEEFNLFTILRAEADEVNLHSRFLYELLNPAGSHQMGSVFLSLFTEICKLPKLNSDKVQVLREHANIDLLIKDGTTAIIIENKIYAGDQTEQLARYYNYAKSLHHQPYLFYLTLHGHEPSIQSLGSINEAPQLISYRNEIANWLTNCIKEAATKPVLRETLVQYRSLVNNLTGVNNADEQTKQQVIKLMAQGDNAENACILIENWGHVRWHTEWDFWNELLLLIENRYKVSDDRKFSSDALDRTVHGRRGRNPWYGLSFQIGTLYDKSVSLRVERNQGPMYYGIPYGAADEAIRVRMRTAIQPITSQSTDAWAGLKANNLGIDFESFTNTITPQLANPDKRKVITDKFYQEIQELIFAVSRAFSKEFDNNFINA